MENLFNAHWTSQKDIYIFFFFSKTDIQHKEKLKEKGISEASTCLLSLDSMLI